MRRASLAVTLLLLVAGGVAGAHGNGKPRNNQRAQVVFLLKHRERALRAFVGRVSDPASPQYRRYLTIEQLKRRFGAPPRARRAVQRWARGRGLSARLDPTGTYLKASLEAGRVGSVLESRTLARAPSGRVAEWSVPGPLRRYLSGVASFVVPRSASPGLPRPAANSYPWPADSSLRPRTGTPSGCAEGRSAPSGGGGFESYGGYGFTPNQYLRAYGISRLLDRTPGPRWGRIALIEAGGYTPSDITTFAACFGLRMPKVRTFLVGIPKQPPLDETELDLQVVIAAAPRVRSIDIYESFDLLNAVTVPLVRRSQRPNVISMSYGGCEAYYSGGTTYLAAFNTVLAFEAGSGISFFSSAGDSGSAGCDLAGTHTPLPLLGVNFPASSPYGTGVGGLNFTLGPRNRIGTELVWNDKPGTGAGGGGPSLLFARPRWQNVRGFASVTRVVPDVAMLADVVPGFAIYCTVAWVSNSFPGGWLGVGGTSAAAPLLAAGVMDADREAWMHHQRPLGLLNPLLYDLHRVRSLRVLRDVTVGSNDVGKAAFGKALGCCSAHPRFDAASGLGSVNVDRLSRAALLAGRHRLPRRAFR